MTISNPLILVVSRDGVLRESIIYALSKSLDGYQLLTTSSLRVAKKLAAKNTPSLMIIDIYTLRQHQWINEIRAKSPDSHILVLDSFGFIEMQEKMVKAGARGVLGWRCGHEELVAGIRDVLAGNRCLSDALVQRVLRRNVLAQVRHSGSTEIENLSPRKQEIVRLIGEGKNAVEITKELGISLKTLETYRDQIKIALGTRNGAELARTAIVHVLLSSER